MKRSSWFPLRGTSHVALSWYIPPALFACYPVCRSPLRNGLLSRLVSIAVELQPAIKNQNISLPLPHAKCASGSVHEERIP
jgi:hypothetical protein